MRPPRLDRRALLRGAAVLGAGAAAGGCASAGPADPPAVPATPDPETRLLQRLIADKETTIALYRRAAAKHTRLRAYQHRHEVHLAELRRHLPPSVAAVSPSPTTPAVPTASPSTDVEDVSIDRLRALEREAAAARPAQLASVSPALAQLLASIGACEAAHALALSRLT